jgi:endo-1,4-beta-xylanase
MRLRLPVFLLAGIVSLPAQQPTLRQAAAKRPLLIGAAADADEYGHPNRLLDPDYASALSTNFNMLEGENAMKWDSIHPSQNAYNFGPGDHLVGFAQDHQMQVRGHNLCWHSQVPAWAKTIAQTATPDAVAKLLQDHIATVVDHYKGQVFAWDVVNEAVSDSATGKGTDLRDSIWYNQPGIGMTGTGYIEQAFRWAHAADPKALLFYNDYSIEGPGPKFQAVYNMVKDFVARGVPIHGVGLQMHLTLGGFPSTVGLTQNIQQLTALGLQVHITEMDVRLKLDANGNATAADLDAQAQTYQRILTVCLQNPGCTAFQTWGFTDKYSWIPGFYPGFGAALPFDASYQPKPAVSAMIKALQTVPLVLKAEGIVNAASYQGAPVAPGEIIAIFGVNCTQVSFDAIAAPFIYSLPGQASVVVPYETDGKPQTTVQYAFNGLMSNTVTIPIRPASPGIFAIDSSGQGPGAILNQDNSVNTTENPAAAGSVIQVFATGGGTISGGAVDGAPSPGPGSQTLPVSATIGGIGAGVLYAGPAPGLVNGVLQVNVAVPVGLAVGPQAVVISVGVVASQDGITVAVR